MPAQKLIDQPTAAPSRKVTAGALGSGAVGIPLGTVAAWWLSTQAVNMPPEIMAALAAALGGAFTSIMGFIAGYATRERAEG
jgi:hypothetical protein